MAQGVFPMKVLVVGDGKEPGRRAIVVAGQLSAATGSELHLVLIKTVARGIYPDFMNERQIDRIEGEAKQELEADLAYAKSEGITPAATYVRLGRLDAEILKLADELDAGMIAVANRPGDSFERILLGDEIESVVRHAHCPVLVVRNRDEPRPSH